MRGVTEKQKLVQWAEHAHTNLLSSIEGLTEEQASRREIDGWSVKDHLTHVTVWNEMRFFELHRIGQGGTFSMDPASEEEILWLNEGFAQARRRLPYAQVIADLNAVHNLIIQAVTAAPEDRLAENLYGEMGPVGAAHEAGHAAIIRTWRDKASV
jgi:hypothetical protein